MWASWIKQNWHRKVVYIVITHDGAAYGDNYAAELADRADQERLAKIKSDVAARISDMQLRRAAARATGDYTLSDALRDEMVAAGIAVNDDSAARRKTPATE